MSLFSASQLQLWRYNIAECIIKIGSESINLLPIEVVGLQITNNYFTDVFPIIKLNLALDSIQYYKIASNRTNVKIKLRVQKYYKTINSDKKSLKRDFINDIFVLIDDEKDVDRSRSKDIEDKRKNADTPDDVVPEFSKQMELYLYREETVIGLKKQINGVFESASLSSIIAYSLGQSGIRNTIMSPLENTTIYKNILIPPLTINKLIAHLDGCYGLYRYGSMIFFGIDRTYILNFKGGCTAWEKNEIRETCFLVPTEIAPEMINGGSVNKNDGKNYINWAYGKIAFGGSTASSNIIYGNNATVVNATNGQLNSSKAELETVGNGITRMINNTGGNKWYADTYTAQMSSNEDILIGSIADFDIDALKPNKKFTIVFEDRALTNKYKGTYILGNTMLKFINTGGSGEFQLVAAIELHRAKHGETTSVSI